MVSLHDRNEAPFFRIVTEHPDEMMPIECAAQQAYEWSDAGQPVPAAGQRCATSRRIAAAVADVDFAQEHAGIERPANLLQHARSCMEDSRYPAYA
ncbi:MAG: hypothetical protein IPM01_29270 [Burkholderiaceae bacterium]|nr:hypothetical protein [Burkholderiaceae bacterium]